MGEYSGGMADELAQRSRRAFWLTIALVPVLSSLWFVPGDDGLRHVGIAFGTERGWGDVYPFSQFERFGNYDPWWGYDAVLALFGRALALVIPDRLARQFVALELLGVLFGGALLWLAARRARIAETICDARSLLFAVLLLALALTDTFARFSLVRPFAFGTLLLLYGVGRAGVVRGFVAAGLAVALYPYLAWIYVGPLVVAHLWRGSRSFALGAMAAALAGAAVQTPDLVGLVLALARAAEVRDAIGGALQIRELAPVSQSLGLVALVLIGIFVLIPALPPERRRWRVEHVMLACFVPVSLVYVRYLFDVVLPLLFVAYGADAARAAHGPFVRASEVWRRWIFPVASTAEPTRPAVLRTFLVLAYALVLAGLFARAVSQHHALASTMGPLRVVPEGSLVLTRFNAQYRMLYARPDLSLVPSSELGFPSESITDAYVAYHREGRVCTLARQIGADFFVERRSGYVDPTDTSCLSLVEDGPPFRIWRIEGNR